MIISIPLEFWALYGIKPVQSPYWCMFYTFAHAYWFGFGCVMLYEFASEANKGKK